MHPPRLSLRLVCEPAVARLSRRVRDICWEFGIPPREPPRVVADRLELPLRPGTISLITGPSGSGKSSLLREMAGQLQAALWVGRPARRGSAAIVDRVAPHRPLSEALAILTACGLGEPRLWVRRETDLSEGERFRAALARAVGRAVSAPDHPVVLCDEFTSGLHRRLAHGISYSLRRLVSRSGLILIAASAHDDVLEDLQPDVHVALGDEPRVRQQTPRPRAVSLTRRAFVVAGGVRDYERFAPMHYRRRDALGFVDKVFLLRDGADGDPLGIAVFAHPPLELALRNEATGGRFRRDPARLNRELRILRRLVLHPDVRGCGLGHWFVRRALPRVGVRFVECLAAMGAVNPVFERAGMTRIGRCPAPRGRMRLLERMRRWKLDPFSPSFAERIRARPRVRRLVIETLRDWMTATRGAAFVDLHARPADVLATSFRQVIGEPPVYYLWDRDNEFPRRPSSRGIDDPRHRPQAQQGESDYE
ncbi:MAG: hypothetical protein L6R00_13535 [Phycisphaerae bacterium]|nr:hypothetical protein [Phycisphaerae bacterium]